MNLLKKPGLRDWWLQRVSTVFILLFGCCFTWFWWSHPGAEYSQWHTFMLSSWMRILTVLMAVSLAVHVAIGWWVVLTDYVKFRWLQMGLLGVVHGVLLALCLGVVYWMWSWV